MPKKQVFPQDKRLLKSGCSLYISIPYEVAESWNLKKGDEVKVDVVDGAIKIEPKQITKIHALKDEDLQVFSEAMKGIGFKVTVDTENLELNIKFSGENKEAMKTLVRNLGDNLPMFLSLLGIRSAQEITPKKHK